MKLESVKVPLAPLVLHMTAPPLVAELFMKLQSVTFPLVPSQSTAPP